MRVLYVNQTAQVSGAERSLLALLQGLAGDPKAAVACPPGELTTELRALGLDPEPIVGTTASFRLHPLHTASGAAEIGRSALQVRRLSKRWRPDLIHANTTRAALLAAPAGLGSGPPVLAHIRDWAPEGRFSRLVLGLIAQRADAVVANSTYIARQFDGMPLRRPVRVIHNPVDLERFDPAAADGAAIRRELGIPGDAVVLSMIAQLTPWKGQDDAIRTLAGLSGDGRDTILLLAGSAKFAGPGTQFDNRAFERELHRLAGERGVTDRVRFAGERSDVPDVLAATDILLMPSWREAFGRIAIEAMAMGVPVAAGTEGGPAEILTEGVDGLLLPPRDPDAWSRGLAPLLDPARRRPMGEAGRVRARDFSVAAHARAVREVYAELV